MTDSILRQYHHLFVKNSHSTHKRTSLALKSALFFLTALAVFVPGLPVSAEMISGKIEKYDPQLQQATIDLGKEDGIDKYDRGKIELTSLDSPNVKFIGANVVVISVEENSAVVSVREAPGVQIPVTVGSKVTVDTESGLARREEEANLLAAQQAEEARRQQQLEQARAEQVRLQREREQALAEEARRQQQLEQARAEQVRLQREREQALAEEARRQQQLEQARQQQEREQALAEEARRQQQLEQARQKQEQEQANAAIPQESEDPNLESEDPDLKPENPDLEEAKEWWTTNLPKELQNSSIIDLPLDYVKAYIATRKEPSSETYYKFAQILIEYEILDRALTWLEEAKFRFPNTKGVNNYYRAVAYVASGNLKQGQNLIETSGIPKNQLREELKSYLYTYKGQWDKVFTLSKNRKSAVTYNNYLIGIYCTKPPALNRDTSLSPSNCPFGKTTTAQPENYDNIETLRSISQEAIDLYPNNPYILNTLGYLALQAEDYDRAFDYYQKLAKVLDKFESTPPELQVLKANAISYLNNYNQNYEFLADTSQDLELLRSQQGSVGNAIALHGVGNILTTITSGLSPAGIVGILASIMSLGESRREAQRIIDERNSLLDQMRVTFARDIKLIPARPNLEAKPLLKLSSNQIEQQLRLYDDFWNSEREETKSNK